MSNQARNLLLLAATAFSQKKFDEAGTLFTASLSSEDAGEFLTELAGAELADGDTAQASDAKPGRTSVSRIAKDIATAMAAESESSEDDDEDDDDDESEDDDEDDTSESSDDEDDDDDEDDESEDDNAEDEEAADDEDDESDDDSETGSSISSAPVPAPKKGRVLISMAASSPVRMKK